MKYFVTTNQVMKGCVAVAALALASCTLQANDPSSQEAFPKKQAEAGNPQAEAGKQMTASSFIQHAAQGNLLEIALADAAKQKAQSEEVKQFAEQLRKDHTEANQKLQSLAQKNGVTMATELDPMHKEKLDKIQQASGQEFDKEFAKEALKCHSKAVHKYQRAAEQLPEGDVKNYAQETLPALRQHLQHGRDLAKNVGIDQSTISSLTRETPESAGGTEEAAESETGAGGKSHPSGKHQEKDKDYSAPK